jgi:hypothetical protein
MNSSRERHIERLIGRRVRDADGVVVGRLEEFRVALIDGDPVVTEFHIGPAALLERMGAFIHQLPFVSLLPWKPTMFCVEWSDMDLTDERHPRVRTRKADLPRLEDPDSNDATSFEAAPR